jgi:phage-related protein
VAEAFKIGEGYVEITSRLDRDQIAKDAERAGDEAGDSFGEKFDKAAKDGAERSGEERTKEFGKGTTRESGKAGKSSGDNWSQEFEKALNGPRKKKKKGDGPKHNDDGKSIFDRLGGVLRKSLTVFFSPATTMKLVKGFMAMLLSPPVIATIVAAAAALGGLLVSGLAAALFAGIPVIFGGGFLVLGISYLTKDAKVKRAFKDLGKGWWTMMDKATKPLKEPLIKVLGILGDTITMMTPTLTAMMTILSRALTPLANGFKGFMANLAPGLLVLTGMSTDGLINVGNYLPKLGTILSDFFIKIQQNWPAIKKSFGEFFKDVTMVIGWIAGALFWLAANYEKMKTILGWSVILSKPVIAAAKAIYAVFKWLYDVLVGHSIVPDLINAIIAWFAKLPGRIVGYVANMVPRVIGWFTRMAGQALAAVGRLVNNAVSALSRLPGRAGSAVSRLWGSMTGHFGAAITNARARAWSLVNGVVNVLSQLPGRARTQAGRVKSAITGAFGNAGSWLVSAGRRIISGLISGIQGMIGSLRNQLGGITNMIPDWKGPAQRDAVLLKPAGAAVMDGFMGGVESRITALKRQLGGITSAMPDMAVSGAPSRATYSTANAGGGLTIGNLTVHVKGVLNENDPVAYRALVVQLQRALDEVSKSRSRSR